MRKLASLLTALVLITTLSPLSLNAADMKIAVVDMQKIFKEYKKTQEADTKLKEQMNSYKTERDGRMEDYRKLVDQIKNLRDGAQDPSLSADARKEKELKLQEKVGEAQQREREIREFDATTQKLFADQSKRMRDKILEEIQGELNKFAKGKYTMIFDQSGMTLNGTATLIYQEGLTDISDELIKLLNAKP
ncbi:MAG: OmpH family outer membrane protein [Candidatus Methylacidiphilales bacterium]